MAGGRIITDIEQASRWLTQGNILAYPTESVWGLGCDAFNEQAVHQILQIKNRPIEKGLIVLTSSTIYLHKFLETLPQSRQNDIIASWDNPKGQATTWLFPIPYDLTAPIPTWITGGHDTLAIRVISHTKIAKLCDLLATRHNTNPYGFVVSTSCNPSNLAPARTLTEAMAYFGDVPNMAYLEGDTLEFVTPSQIRCAISGNVMRE